jgi:hypothetical protein
MVLLPGRLTRSKGQLVQRSGRWPPGVRAVVAGHPQGCDDYVKELMAAINGNELNRIALLSEPVGDTAAAYLASDIVSASPDPEPFGRVPPEAFTAS